MFYGWWIVLASVVGLFLSIAPVVTFTLGVFLKPLSQEFNWNRAEISFAYTLCTLAGSAALPIIGRVVDRYGVRTVVAPSLLLFGACLTSLYFLQLIFGICTRSILPLGWSAAALPRYHTLG